MESKTKGMNLFVYIAQAIIWAVAYGLVAFFVIYQWLADEVILTAYILHVVSIVAFLVVDIFSHNIVLSDAVDAKTRSKFVGVLVFLSHSVSFKTTLYLFYTFVLIVSRVSLISPELLDDSLRGFVSSIEYCLILLVAFDKFIEHLLKDDKRVQRINAKFTKFSNYVAKKREHRRQKKRR
ncbi:MAG: hypothetical protein FWC89_09640 [Defluviitaleaceae bacterium]|nr:hypothetical protein [Defluviitaleaceae bacterium]